MTLDIISIGDATEDVFLQLQEADVHCDRGEKRCELCMFYADKIPVKRVDKLIGGNASNLAIGMSRLGFRSGYYCVLGKDDQGERILSALKRDGVNTRYVQLVKGAATNYSVVLNLNAERTILIYHVERSYTLPKMETVPWLYYTSMGKGFEAIHKDLVGYIRKNRVRLGFNPGTHQLRKAKELKPLLKLSEVVLLNKEETQLLLKTTADDFRKLLTGLRRLGPKIAVVTDGPKGSYAYDGKAFYFQGIYDVPIVERTGCGDSYSTGFIAALMSGLDIREAMKWGTVNAASVIQQIGPQAGLATKKELLDMLRAKPKFGPVELT